MRPSSAAAGAGPQARSGGDAALPALPITLTGAPDAAAARARHQIAVWWLGSRAFVLATALVAQITPWPWTAGRTSFGRHPFSLLGSWDALWYRMIAEHGYLLIPGHSSDPAFFPLLPVLEHWLGRAGIPDLVSGALIANGAFLVALLAMYELGRRLLPEPDARRAALYLAIFPYGFVFSMAYPEGLALALVALAGLLAERNRWLPAGLAAAAATLARPEGIFLALPLAAVAYAARRSMSPSARSRAFAAVLAGPAALAAFCAYLWVAIGSPLAWSEAESAWGRAFSPYGVVEAVARLASAPSHHHFWLIRDALCCAGYVVLLKVAWRAGVPRGWILFGLAIVIVPLASGTFTSDGRFGLLALPVFWGLAVVGRNRRVHRIVVAASLVLLAAGVVSLTATYP